MNASYPDWLANRPLQANADLEARAASTCRRWGFAAGLGREGVRRAIAHMSEERLRVIRG